MAKSTKVVSKKAQAPAEVAPAQVPAPSKPVRARKEKAEQAVEDPSARWKRRLARWQAKAVAAGVDAKALMAEALAG